MVFVFAVILWHFKKTPVPDLNPFKKILSQVVFSIKSDKFLLVLFVLFIFCSLITLFFVIFVPANDVHSLAYKLSRVAFWIQNKTLEHYETTSIRQVVFPVNAELMTLWSMVFLKKDYLALFTSFFSYFGCLGLISVFLRNTGISIKRILWVALIVGSLPILILEASSMQNNLFLGFLLMTSFYLFTFAVRKIEKLPMFFFEPPILNLCLNASIILDLRKFRINGIFTTRLP